MSKWRILTVGLAVIGLAFIAVAIVYWVEPSGSLPHWFPGYVADGGQPSLEARHTLGRSGRGLLRGGLVLICQEVGGTEAASA